MSALPIVIDASGLVPTTPATLNANLIATVAATNVDYTILPGGLIEDISSTDTYALVQCDTALVETVNSITPYGANAFLLNQLGQVYGVPLGLTTNTSVLVVFTGPPGLVIGKGFIVSDGTYQYILTDGGVIGAGGTSIPLFALATQPGSWVVPSGTVQNLITPPPTGINLSVNNPLAGTPGSAAEMQTSYRSRVLQAGLANAQGTLKFLKTLLANVSGVQPRLISAFQIAGGGWEILCGGGDPYQVGYAIYRALGDISTLVGSSLLVSNITQANPGVVTTTLNHGFATGQVIEMTGVQGMFEVNSVPYTITVIDEKNFSIVNTSGFLAYTGGGLVTPNLRNVQVSLQDYPDTYIVNFVNPPQQSVSITATWGTTATNFVSSAGIAQAASAALVDYVNSLPVGVPINQFELITVFQAAVASILPPQLLTRLLFSVSINNVATPPLSGTGIIQGDPESYFLTNSTLISVIQG